MWKNVTLAAFVACAPVVTSADLTAQFREGAPKDRFTFTNTSACAIQKAVLTLDLSTSQAGLIFDVTGDGAGVEVFQPLQIVSGATALSQVPRVKDGDARVQFEIADLKPGGQMAFTIDVDDTLGTRAITVSGAEISGATFSLSDGSTMQAAQFNASANARMPVLSCES